MVTHSRINRPHTPAALVDRRSDRIEEVLREQLGAADDEEDETDGERECGGDHRNAPAQVGATSASVTPSATTPNTIVTPAMKPVAPCSSNGIDSRRRPSSCARS
jgi:hypothetical protein